MRADVSAVKRMETAVTRYSSLRVSFLCVFNMEPAIPFPPVLSHLLCPAVHLIPGKNHSHSARLLNQNNKSLPNPENKMQMSNAGSFTDGWAHPPEQEEG
jgi:hypothetical protein